MELNIERKTDLITKLFPNACLLDYNENGFYSDNFTLMVIIAKSLMPMKEEGIVALDKRRYYEEIKLWRYYCKEDGSEYIEKLLNPVNYWEQKDHNLIWRIIPLLIVNRNFNGFISEVTKTILSFTGNIASLFDGLLYATFLHKVVNGKAVDINRLKEYVLKFKQEEFLARYKEIYRYDISDYPEKYKLCFEREKINIISILNDVCIDGFPLLKSIIMAKKDSFNSEAGKLIQYAMKTDLKQETNEFNAKLNQYLIKLRNFKIDKDRVQISEYILPDIFEYKEGDEFNHSLLGECKIIEKTGNFTIKIETKSGIYEMQKRHQ